MIFDTDVLIWTLRGDPKAAETIDRERVRQVSIVSQMELIQGARDRRELTAIRRFLADFETLPLSAEIGFRARLYLEAYAIGHSLGLADAIIAATAVEAQSTLCTANVRHFRPIKDLTLKAFHP